MEPIQQGETIKSLARLFESGRYLVYIAVVSSLLSAAVTFLVGVMRLWENSKAFVESIQAGHVGSEIGINMIGVVDAFLLATVLYIFAVGLYELFIGDLEVPDWLEIHNLDDLKAKLQSVIIMIMAVLFLEHLAEWEHPLETLMFGAAIALVTVALTLYSSKKSGHGPNSVDLSAGSMGKGQDDESGNGGSGH